MSKFIDTDGAFIACTFIRELNWQELKDRTNVWSMPGNDGFGVQSLGKGDGEFSYEAVLFGTVAELDAWAVTIEAMQGTIVSIQDDFYVLGRPQLDNRLVEKTIIQKITPAAPPVTNFRGVAVVTGKALA